MSEASRLALLCSSDCKFPGSFSPQLDIAEIRFVFRQFVIVCRISSLHANQYVLDLSLTQRKPSFDEGNTVCRIYKYVQAIV